METMDTKVSSELLEASDEAIDAALEYADPMVLRGLVYQLTGDEEVISTELGSVGAGFFKTMAVVGEQDITLLRKKAAALLKDYRDTGGDEIDSGPPERLPKSLELACGKELGDDHLAWSIEELGLNPWSRSLEWKNEPSEERLSNFSVTVIGTGLGGLNAAVQLKRAGIPFSVIEKNADLGGTWHENRYPGIRVDSPSRAYTHIFGANFDYKYPFSPGDENRRYLNWVADSFDLRDDIAFDTEVEELRWDDTSSEWELKLKGGDGPTIVRSNAVVTSVGFLNRPNVPEIEGMADFTGPSWHTARWPEGFDPTGKRIAVVGTGCSGYQLIPVLAEEAAEVVVFQRRPQWMVPVPGYLAPHPPEVAWLERNVPLFANFARFRVSLLQCAFSRLATIDPDFDDPDAINALNKEQRDVSIAFLEDKLGPELAAKMTPPHPLASARPVVIDPEHSILDALKQDHVTLVTEGIDRINESGIKAMDGSQHDVDAIVFATGFEASEYLFPMTVIGREGKTLEEEWAIEGAKAYRGVMVPGFPNLWMMYGPNTNAGLPIPALQEMSMQYALRCMERLTVDDIDQIEPKRDAFQRWNDLIDERNSRMAWSDPRSQNYYWTEFGRSATMVPLHADELWHSLHYLDFEELETR
jgi:4-hydroxyacetophenone monooxygenase